mmetsp:Transcript_1488/g.2649  ORF Transcript_1488/g.2649 Transcript_1488/m.2649 type:complete len:241 (-) Transcript_1488:311-1033(-)|eukprot:CAMPEP_0196137464 /NCGR_PEP_ID=MMETSP0910-20130528/5433_1 /TAXON_ID=49265 /ORGANISM="Thalassiosira rotula, Strain GSO102" /LENGTH=240 /DNA_ID=CAMNT_0041397923 /DNA_START=157 /DNA_END=879 /DNA_ORIENTATION=+
MALSNAEKKRRSRATKPAKYHDHERETSRKRMAVYRAKNKAQKRAHQLKNLLSEGVKKEIEAHATMQRQFLVGGWFRNHKHKSKFDPKMISQANVMDMFMTKAEIHDIELQVAQFEISIIEGSCGEGNYKANPFNEFVLEGNRGKSTEQSANVEGKDMFGSTKDVSDVLRQPTPLIVASEDKMTNQIVSGFSTMQESDTSNKQDMAAKKNKEHKHLNMDDFNSDKNTKIDYKFELPELLG